MANTGDGEVGGDLTADQLGRLRRARRRFGIRILVSGLCAYAFLGLVYLSRSSSVDLGFLLVFVPVYTVGMAVVVPRSQLSMQPGKGSAAMRRLAICAEPGEMRRVSKRLRQRRPVDGADVEIAQARVDWALEQRQVGIAVAGALLLMVGVWLVWSKMDSHPLPWPGTVFLFLLDVAVVWRVVLLFQLIAGAEEQGFRAIRRR